MDDSATQVLTFSHTAPSLRSPDCPSLTPTPQTLEDSVSLSKIVSQEPSAGCNVEPLLDRSRRSDCGSQEEWPEIRSIVRKIGKLQSNLANERKLYRELSKRSKLNEARMKTYEEEVGRGKEREQEMAKMKEQIELHLQREGELMAKVVELEQLIQIKDEELADRQAVLAEVQVSNLKRIAEMEDKQRKLNNDNKELADRIRKANAELQKEKKLNKELKSEMSGRLEQMQANKDTYLLEEIEQLKAIIDQSKSQREAQLEGDVEALNKRVYQLEEDIKRKDIQLNLMQRKKQQAVAEVQEKKDQQSKLQKTVFKTLTDKYNKLNEEVKVLKQQNQEIIRTNRLTRYFEEQISLELSPDRC